MTRQKSKRAREDATSGLLWQREVEVDWSQVPASPEAWFRDVEGRGLAKLRSAGGRARADMHHVEQAEWQKAATEIWAREPELKTLDVARRIKKRLHLAYTPKHIARYIQKP
jgi:hypothetical protein